MIPLVTGIGLVLLLITIAMMGRKRSDRRQSKEHGETQLLSSIPIPRARKRSLLDEVTYSVPPTWRVKKQFGCTVTLIAPPDESGWLPLFHIEVIGGPREPEQLRQILIQIHSTK